jgi:hypothetical protein
MWEPRPLATLGASTACNRDIFTFILTSSSCDNGRCQYANVCYRECCAAHCRLPSSGRTLLRKVSVRRSWFDHLTDCFRHLMTCILKTKRHGTFAAQYSRIFFNKESYYGNRVPEITFSQYTVTRSYQVMFPCFNFHLFRKA